MQIKVNWTYPKGLNLVRLRRLSRSLSANTLIIVCCFDRDAGAQGATKPSKNNQAAHVTWHHAVSWAGEGASPGQSYALPSSHAVCPHYCLQAGLKACRDGVCLAVPWIHTDCVKRQAGAHKLQEMLWFTVSRACWSLHRGKLLHCVWRDGSQTVSKPSVETSQHL